MKVIWSLLILATFLFGNTLTLNVIDLNGITGGSDKNTTVPIITYILLD